MLIKAIFFAFIFISNSVFAKSDVKFLETQLVFDGKKRSGKLTIFNQGDSPATAEIIFKKHIIYCDGEKVFKSKNEAYDTKFFNKHKTNIKEYIAGKNVVEIDSLFSKCKANKSALSALEVGDLIKFQASPKEMVYEIKSQDDLKKINIIVSDLYKINTSYNKYPYDIDVTQYLKISPRKITLDPKKKQTFRVFLRKPEEFPDGEYRIYSFLQIKELFKEKSDIVPEGETIALDIGVSVSLGIPIVVTHGDIQAMVDSVDDIKITTLSVDDVAAGETHSLKAVFARKGKKSFAGFACLSYDTKRKKKKDIFCNVVNLYPDNDIQRFSHNFAPGIDLQNIPELKLILYNYQKDKVILEKIIAKENIS